MKNLKFLGADGQVLTAGKSGKVPPGQLNGTGSVGNGNSSASEPFQYYYHPDHLGSTSYVTDATGEVYQHLEYFAFGETFVEEHSNTNRTPYLFNGKELDEETGLYYYGARYYDARTSIWQSVDPLAEKYSGLSPFNYTANNPLNAIDPDGKVIIFINGYYSFPTGACCSGTMKHWGSSWVSRVQSQVGDYKARFYDGSLGGAWGAISGGGDPIPGASGSSLSLKTRQTAGYNMGLNQAADIINNLERDANGNVTESIKFVTSSMGTAYERGFSQGIMDYVAEENRKIDEFNSSLLKNKDGTYKDPSKVKQRLNVIIESTIDLDAFQGSNLSADPNAVGNYYMVNDGSENYFIGSAIPGSTQISVDSKGKTTMHGHHPSWADPKAFPKSTMNPKGKGTTEFPAE